MKKRSFLRVFKNKYFIIGVVIVAVILYVLTRGSSSPVFESAVVTVGNVIEKVSVTGTVSPVDKADLAFQKSGVITKVAVNVGDHVNKGELIASIDSTADVAALVSAQAQLAELNRGLRPEEYALDQANLDAASTTLANANKNAVNAVRDGYVKAQSAIVNYTDIFFSLPQSVNPQINIPVQSPNIETNINYERVLVSDTLSHWKDDTNSVGNITELISKAEGYLTTIKSFMSDLSSIVNNLSVGASGMSQSAINADVISMNNALATLTQAITSITTADTALKSALSGYTQANNQFTLQKAGSSADTIAVQAAKVSQAQAVLANDSIFSPISGTVTRADPHVGEFASAGQSGFAVQSVGNYKIEAFVPEADIAKLALKNHATVTLDAYGSYVFFPTSVTAIDPAETVLEGVPTYKVTLMFDTPDARIRSGMTANTDIQTHEVDGVLTVPTRAVVLDNNKKSVRIVNADGKTFTSVPVTVGLKSSDGTIEIISGLTAGQKVVTYTK